MITPVDIAVSQLGVKEATNRNDGVPSERYQENPYNPGQYRTVAWCALFVLWCYRVSSRGPIETREKEWWLWANVNNFRQAMDARGLFFDADTPRFVPLPNDIIIMKGRGGSDAGPGGHMGLVTHLSGLDVMSIDGNWGHRVWRVRRPVGQADIAGYVRIPRPGAS